VLAPHPEKEQGRTPFLSAGERHRRFRPLRRKEGGVPKTGQKVEARGGKLIPFHDKGESKWTTEKQEKKQKDGFRSRSDKTPWGGGEARVEKKKKGKGGN